RDAEEGPRRPAIAAPPGDGPLGVEALEVADEEHAEVDARGDGVSAFTVGIVGLAKVLGVAVEAGFGEQGVELVVEGVAGGLGQVGGDSPEVRLPLGRPMAHAHGEALARHYGLGWPNIPHPSRAFSTAC